MRVPEGTNRVSNDTELMPNTSKTKGRSKTMHGSAKAKTRKAKGKTPDNFKIPKKQTIDEQPVHLSDFSLNDSGSESEVDFSEGDSHPKRLKQIPLMAFHVILSLPTVKILLLQIKILILNLNIQLLSVSN